MRLLVISACLLIAACAHDEVNINFTMFPPDEWSRPTGFGSPLGDRGLEMQTEQMFRKIDRAR
ncbi:MAG: hypothetical protein J4F40_05625 [Alphaproteobacteria bacterium]|nr:hypothetical protein [Alphaproteobacteria bacterium]MCY4499642.1 hypothetical protein [Rhodospirillaceae bacterium]